MSPTTVFHSKDGLYGEPTSLGGTIFYGAGMQDTKTVYKDPASGDTITVKADPEGAACHTGNETCFFRKIENDGIVEGGSIANSSILNEVYNVVVDIIS